MFYSLAFPNMFTPNGVKVISDREATESNIKLLLASWKKSLLGDPYFGTKLKTYIFEQNNIILRDIIIDDILISLQQFIPQIKVTRKDISLKMGTKEDKVTVWATINCINKLDSTLDTYSIKLLTDG